MRSQEAEGATSGREETGHDPNFTIRSRDGFESRRSRWGAGPPVTVDADYKRFGQGGCLTAQSASAAAGWAFPRLDEISDGQISPARWQGDVCFAEIGGASFNAYRDKNLRSEEFTNRR